MKTYEVVAERCRNGFGLPAGSLYQEFFEPVPRLCSFQGDLPDRLMPLSRLMGKLLRYKPDYFRRMGVVTLLQDLIPDGETQGTNRKGNPFHSKARSPVREPLVAS